MKTLLAILLSTMAVASGSGDLYALNHKAETLAHDIARAKQDTARIQMAIKFRRELVSSIRALSEPRTEEDRKYQQALRSLKVALEVIDESELDADRCAYYRGLKHPDEAAAAGKILESLCTGR